MDTEQFIDNFKFSGARGYATDGDIRLIQDFLSDHSESAKLWNFCGDVIQLSDSDPSDYTLNDARICYETAVEKFPNDAEGYESLGFWHDVHGNLVDSEKYFRLAIQRTDSDTPKLGIARVFAELGRVNDGLAMLDECKDQASLDLKSLRDEINEGIWSPE